jgi:hypothetical protein
MNSKPVTSSPASSTPKQEEFKLTPEYAEANGVKFEFNGSLLVPAPGEAERLEREKPVEFNPVCLATPKIVSPQSHYFGYDNTTGPQRVKMSAKQMHKLRSKNA